MFFEHIFSKSIMELSMFNQRHTLEGNLVRYWKWNIFMLQKRCTPSTETIISVLDILKGLNYKTVQYIISGYKNPIHKLLCDTTLFNYILEME